MIYDYLIRLSIYLYKISIVVAYSILQIIKYALNTQTKRRGDVGLGQRRSKAQNLVTLIIFYMVIVYISGNVYCTIITKS
jgi:hypothetical protein